jgi:hypothetical protein
MMNKIPQSSHTIRELFRLGKTLSYQKIGFKAPSFYDGFPKTFAITTSTIKFFDCSRHRAWGDFKRTAGGTHLIEHCSSVVSIF